MSILVDICTFRFYLQYIKILATVQANEHEKITLSCLQVNGDVIFHRSNKQGEVKVIYVDTGYVGKLILTNKPGSSIYEDITSTYKYPESKFHSISVYRIKK